MQELLASRRLVTLLGSGGVGKTRVALEAARQEIEADRFPDGIWFVDLAPLSLPELVTTTIARLLGVREQPDVPLLGSLIAAIAAKKILLVLDNCEHVLDECPPSQKRCYASARVSRCSRPRVKRCASMASASFAYRRYRTKKIASRGRRSIC